MPADPPPADTVSIDRAVLYEVLDDMADAALALEHGSAPERARCTRALRSGISSLWLEAAGDPLRPSTR